MILTRMIVVAGVLGTLCLCACSHAPAVSPEAAGSSGKVVATADRGVKITFDQLFTAINNYPLNLPTGGDLPESTAQFWLDSMLADTLTGFEAEYVRLEDYGPYFREYRERFTGTLAAFSYQQSVDSMVRVDSQAVLDFYELHQKQYVVGEQAEICHILVSPVHYRTGPDSALYKGKNQYQLDTICYRFSDSLYHMLKAGADFKKIAEQYSHDDQSRDRGGYIGWASKGVYHPPFDSVVFGMKVGDFSKPYRDQDGFHLVYVVNHMDSGPLPIQNPDVFAQIRKDVIAERTRNRAGKVIDSLIQGLEVTFNPVIVDSLIIDVPDSVWYAVVNQADTIFTISARALVDNYMGRRRLRTMTEPQKKTAIEVGIRRALFAALGRKLHFDTVAAVREPTERFRRVGCKRILQDQWYGPDWNPSDSEIAAYYDRHVERFVPARPMKVQQIICKDSITAEFVRNQANSGLDFMELAAQYYPGANQAVNQELADLGEIGPNDVDSNFFRTALATGLGEVSIPVKTKYGWHIIKVLSRKDPRPLADAVPIIKDILIREHRLKEFAACEARLFAKYHVKYPEKIDHIRLSPVKDRKKL
jgi:parvulin-like peptidyl-prolyl isomerase